MLSFSSFPWQPSLCACTLYGGAGKQRQKNAQSKGTQGKAKMTQTAKYSWDFAGRKETSGTSLWAGGSLGQMEMG